jgi:hypothetical protein
MALNLDLTPYRKAIESGSKLKDELVLHKQPISGHICDVISACNKLIVLGQDASAVAENSRKFYLKHIQDAQQPLNDIEWTATVLVIAKEFLEDIKAIVSPPTPTPTPKEKAK